MKQDEIIEMAREAGLYQDINVSFHQALKNFYDLVDAKEHKKWQEQTVIEIHEAVLEEREACGEAAMKAAEKAVDVAMKLEREACAKIAEHSFGVIGSTIALAIKARGEA
jgi:hypothetical protein